MSDSFRTELVALLPRLRRFALGLCADPHRADDLVQAACERALARRAQWQEGTRLDSWMYRIVQNLWIDQLRAPGRTVEPEEQEVETVAEERDWTEDMHTRLTLAQVTAALGQLPPAMRAVLVLVCVEDKSYKEAAAILEVPIGTVMSRLARARLALHRVLQEVPRAPLH